ncbi:hypothetical protein MiSe_11060 [Microseira wollei NIES-4236]|uniref:Transposase n=1 Tax=Microseira wollei NIES-4236 TaxID=2530354 RepID=A0AAV3XAI8_9CYAN|nr:hypothetical protein MiSe_11060 [Microseira wollei NIES-4236]
MMVLHSVSDLATFISSKGEPRQPPVFHRQFKFCFGTLTLDLRQWSTSHHPHVFPISDVSAASLTTLKLAFLFHTVGWVINHLYNIIDVSILAIHYEGEIH